MLDYIGLKALQAGFLIAAIAPLLLVLLYRFVRVEARRGEISAIMAAAFGEPEPNPQPTNDPRILERRQARLDLDANPYISDLRLSFIACHSWKQYFFPMLLLAVLTGAICAVLYVWVRIQLSPGWKGGPISTVPLTIVMALAGGYVWSLYQIVNRVRSDELGPGDLSEIGLGLIACAPIGFGLSLITNELDNVKSFVAFAASAFPLRETQRVIQEQMMKRAVGADTPASAPRPTERSLGTAVEGISDQTLVRLRELRIVTVLDMAYSDPIRVMLQTGYSLPLVIDWMDQSLLALYTGDKRGDLTKLGLRCSLDAYEFVEQHGLWDRVNNRRGAAAGASANAEALKVVATKLDVDANLLQDLLLRIYSDPQVIVLRRLWYVNGAPPAVRAEAA
jgi:hypothetical protein